MPLFEVSGLFKGFCALMLKLIDFKEKKWALLQKAVYH